MFTTVRRTALRAKWRMSQTLWVELYVPYKSLPIT
jgi:hypothetical protein